MIQWKILVTLDLPTPLYFCCSDPIEYDGNNYETAQIKAPKVKVASPSSMDWYITILDHNWAMHDDLDDNPDDWGNFEVSFRKIILRPGEESWTPDALFVMTKTECHQDLNDGWMKIDLSAVVGNGKKACLREGDRYMYPDCPPSNATIDHDGQPVRFSSGSRSHPEPPNGEAPRYLYRRPMGRQSNRGLDEPLNVVLGGPDSGTAAPSGEMM